MADIQKNDQADEIDGVEVDELNEEGGAGCLSSAGTASCPATLGTAACW